MKNRLLFVLLILISTWGLAQEEQYFESGNQHYKAGEFQAAIDDWMKILDSELHSANLYFNLGNAHYKMNNIGPSIYYYEKALQLKPGDKDILNNLAFAENAKVDVVEALPESVFKRWYKNISGILTFDGWALFAVASCILSVLLFLGYYFSYSEGKKRAMFSASLVFGILTFSNLLLAFKTHSDFSNNQPAIIFSESAEVRAEPSLGSETAFIIHEGTKVQIEQRDLEWVQIVLADGKEGWIPSSYLKEL